MSKDRLIPPMTQKEILAEHERRLKALEKAVKALTLRSIEVKPSNIISHLPQPNNTPKIINFDSEPWLGSGRLYSTEDVRKLLAQQAELSYQSGYIRGVEVALTNSPELLNKPSNE